VHDASKEVRVHLKKQVMLSPEFMALWERIKGRTAYRVAVDDALLKDRCLTELSRLERIPKAHIVSRTANIDIENSGVTATGETVRATELEDEAHRLPDFLRAVDNECFLSQKVIAAILFESGRLQDFLNNPQRMTELFIETIKSVQNGMEIDGIRYHRLAGEEYYLQEIFDSSELVGYLGKTAVEVEHSVYDYVLYDSDTVERPFAVALDDDPDVKMFFKIPDKFKIETPIGTYNPDWAVYLDKDGEEKLYFVLETKGVSGLLGLHNLKTPEQQKIHCGEEHFKALGSGVEFSGKPVKDWREFKVEIS
jgi:type III restriction enzyme